MGPAVLRHQVQGRPQQVGGVVMRTYVDVHILQTVPPSNINRDDAGSPKQATYGGVRRARVSSQAWKRATRQAFTDHIDEAALATRTRRVSTLLASRIADRGGLDAEPATRIATALLADLGIKAGKKETDTAYLLFFGRAQMERLIDPIANDLARIATLSDDELTDAVSGISARAVLGEGHPIDVALFGRMVADIPGLNVDAAAQVAHAISTHAVDTEFDYFTAVDDENTADETGAGMIGTVEFSSSTLYRYATVGLHQLTENLGEDVNATVEALRVFLTTFATSMPTGHQNSFAHRTPPNLVTVVVRDDQPVNLVSAFERPVRPINGGVVSDSITALGEELGAAAENWGLRPALVASTYRAPEPGAQDKAVEALGTSMPFEQVVATVVAAARERLTGTDR
ncbi:type I-E CRISPR-associated protein Cas7/Cse4/CasC [Pseudonocardia sp. CA-107938]|uniref:type I-E CRISPR-associated protein Cas7/Cse4/CasC n=1 Tax=Pseudonocardia sp. CA-107938 TaxID=3240021 RepID=UPI003D90ABEC